jgi:hypothetical protein
MKYLKEFRIFEETQSGPLYLEHAEIEALPAFKRMTKFIGSIQDSTGDKRPARPGFSWTEEGIVHKRGIRILAIPYSRYSLRFNPKNRSLKYGQETINKNFELPYETLDDWNKAVEEADKFQLARYLNMNMSTFRSLADPAKLQRWIGKTIEAAVESNQYKASWLPNKTSDGEAIEIEIRSLSAIVPHIIELHGIPKSSETSIDFNKMLVEYFAKKIKKDTGRIEEVPEIYRKGVLSKMGYSDDESNVIASLKDVGIF